MTTVSRASVGLKPSPLLARVERVNKELWLILSMFVIAAVLNFLVASQRMVLGFYMLPTLGSAYFYGKRHATLTALGSVLLVVLLAFANPSLLSDSPDLRIPMSRWLDLLVWGSILVIIGYLMGTLYEFKTSQLQELRHTYHGVLLILRHFISQDKYTENHSYRVSVYAARIAEHLNFNEEQIEDVRAAALLHDIGKLDISRDLLYKAARLTQAEFEEIQQHVEKGIAILEPVGGSLRRVLPIILAHHEKFDGSGYHSTRGGEIPLEARIISVADVYDALTSDRPYRKAMPPIEAKDQIVKGAGTEFDPDVVQAFVTAFRQGELEIPQVMV